MFLCISVKLCKKQAIKPWCRCQKGETYSFGNREKLSSQTFNNEELSIISKGLKFSHSGLDKVSSSIETLTKHVQECHSSYLYKIISPIFIVTKFQISFTSRKVIESWRKKDCLCLKAANCNKVVILDKTLILLPTKQKLPQPCYFRYKTKAVCILSISPQAILRSQNSQTREVSTTDCTSDKASLLLYKEDGDMKYVSQFCNSVHTKEDMAYLKNLALSNIIFFQIIGQTQTT